MLRKVATVGVCISALTGVLAGNWLWAKPADLPSNPQIECSEPDRTSEPSEPPVIDAVLPAFVEQWLQHAGDLLSRPERMINMEAVWKRLPSFSANANTETPRLVPANEKTAAERTEQLYTIAEAYRVTGSYRTARFYYQRAHATAPASRFGRMAIERLQDLEERLRDAEESDPVRPPQESPEEEDILKDYVPLGLVRHMY
jgi:hypothetical protein